MKGLAGYALLVFAVSVPAAELVPEFQKLRQDEDWTNWCNSSQDRFSYKCIRPLLQGILSFGGEFRERFENTNNPTWGDSPQDKHGVFMQRYVAFADFRTSPTLRFFGQINSALESGREGGPSPVDENQLSIQQAFVQWLPSANSRLTLGRQELNLGSGRLVDVREGPNVRRRFDAIQFELIVPNWTVNFLVARPWILNSGTFDDRLNYQQRLWGLYGETKNWEVGSAASNIDLYYLGYQNDLANYLQGTAEELRHSIGVRLWGKQNKWHWDWEFIYQFGHFGEGNIRAWSIASNTGRLLAFDFQPEIGISTNIASGDSDRTSPNLGAFNAIYPRGNYFSELALLGPRNFFNLHPYFSVDPASSLNLTFEVDFFWRLSSDDGIYGPAGQLLREAQSTNSHYVATEASVNATWSLTRNLHITAIYGHSFPGAVIKESGASKHTDFFEFTMKCQY